MPVVPIGIDSPLDLSDSPIEFSTKGTGDGYRAATRGGAALTLDGSGSFFRWLNVASDWGITMSCWCKPASFAATGAPMYLGASSSNVEFNFFNINTTPRLQGVRRTAADGEKGSGTVTGVVLNAWNHCASIADFSNSIAYLNGLSGTANTDTLTTPGTAWNVTTVGRLDRSSATQHFNGAIADARIYNRILPQSEIMLQVHDPWDLYYELGQRTYIFPAHFPPIAAVAAAAQPSLVTAPYIPA